MTTHSGNIHPELRVGSVRFATTTLHEAVDHILDLAKASGGTSIRFANAYCVAEASKNPTYMQLLNDSGTNFPDGTPVAWVMRLKARSLKPGRVRGPSLFKEVIDRGRDRNIRHFLLGTTPHTLRLLQASIEREYPGTKISGTYAPAFGPIDDEFTAKCLSEVKKRPTDLIWVALGSPKQDYATTLLARQTGITALGVGAAFDFMAGTSTEAPIFFQKYGLEWAYRFASEPRRLWRRYLVGNLVFIRAVTKFR